ncbi:MAG: FAD-dependent oxidoreductase [Pseudomonadota bacterium]
MTWLAFPCHRLTMISKIQNPSTHAKRRVIVIGAGIVGATTAWQLARAGHTVTIIDRDEPGGLATPCSFGWINATFGFPRPYFNLRLASMAAWSRLAQTLPDLPVQRSGGLYLHLDDADGEPVNLLNFATSHRSWGYEIEELGGNALRARAPHMRALPASAVFARQEGAADADRVAERLIEESVAAGASMISGVAVDGLVAEDERVIAIDCQLGRLFADEVIVAAGAATSDLVSAVAPPIPLKTPAGILIHTKPYRPLVPHLTLARDLHIRQASDGRIIAGWDFGGGSGPDNPDEAAVALLDRIRASFEGADDIELEHISVGYRPTPRDGFPVVGRPGERAGLIVAVMHSGVTLAPIVAEGIRQYLETGEWLEELQPYGPSRFDGESVAAFA